MSDSLPRLYGELAEWFHLLTAPEEYAEEAAIYWRAIVEAADRPPRTLLELGSGGGNNAMHYKRHLAEVTLVDLSPAMLAISRQVNPECEHVAGDMRTVRLGRTFDAVFVHDAVMYLTSEGDLRQAFETAFVHCRPGGVAVFAPDCVRETFEPSTSHGGNDGAGRGVRYLDWTWDPDPADTTYVAEMAYLLREDGQPMRHEHERHVLGLFGRDVWLGLLAEVGFRARVQRFEWSDLPTEGELFVGVRPG